MNTLKDTLKDLREGFFRNVNAEANHVPVMKYIDNMVHANNAMMQPVRDAFHECIPSDISIGEKELSAIAVRQYNSNSSTSMEWVYNKLVNDVNHVQEKISQIGDLCAIGRLIRVNITITPELLGDDPKQLPDWMNLFPSKVNVNNGCDMISIGCLVIAGFKNLEDLSNVLLPAASGSHTSLNASMIIIAGCPKLADKSKIVDISKVASNRAKIIFFPDDHTAYTLMDIKRKLRFSSYNELMYNKGGYDNVNNTPKVNPASLSTPITPKASASPASIDPKTMNNLPILIYRDNKVYTADNQNDPIGRVTRDGKKIYKMNQANIWLTVNDVDGGRVCMNKRGIPLYILK